MVKNIGNLYPTKIPDLTDDADIREAFYLYHYGSVSGDSSVQSESIASYLGAISDVADGAVPVSSYDSKGDILVGTGDGTYVNVPTINTSGFEHVLVIDSDEAAGVRWVMSAKEEERIAHIMGVY